MSNPSISYDIVFPSGFSGVESHSKAAAAATVAAGLTKRLVVRRRRNIPGYTH